MTRHYSDLGSAFDWLKQISLAERPIRSTTQILVVTRHQYGISHVCSSDVIWRGNKRWHREISAIFSGFHLIRDPYKDSALAAMFQEPSYAAKDSNWSSHLFTRERFFLLKSIRIPLISLRSCWFLSKVHEACELGIVSLSRLYPKKQLPQRHAHFWIFS